MVDESASSPPTSPRRRSLVRFASAEVRHWERGTADFATPQLTASCTSSTPATASSRSTILAWEWTRFKSPPSVKPTPTSVQVVLDVRERGEVSLVFLCSEGSLTAHSRAEPPTDSSPRSPSATSCSKAPSPRFSVPTSLTPFCYSSRSASRICSSSTSWTLRLRFALLPAFLQACY